MNSGNTMNYHTEKIEIENEVYDIFIGKNAKGNDQIISQAHPESLWFHFEDISSPHIVLESKGSDIPKRWLYQIALRLFQYKQNAPKRQPVIYTKIKHVKLTSIPGSVITQHTKTIKMG